MNSLPPSAPLPPAIERTALVRILEKLQGNSLTGPLRQNILHHMCFLHSCQTEVESAKIEAKLLMIPQAWESPARAAAADLNIPIMELHIQPNHPAGTLQCVEKMTSQQSAICYSGPEDCALLLHTSGTTSRPKFLKRNL